VTPYSLVEVYRRFGGTYVLHLQGLKISQLAENSNCSTGQLNIPKNRTIYGPGLEKFRSHNFKKVYKGIAEWMDERL
jgi:hypothetical protein